MAYIDHVWGHQYLCELGDGQTTEVFTPIALLNTEKAIDFSSETASAVIKDATDLSLPGKKVARVISTSVTITGSGKVAQKSVKAILDWQLAGTAKNMKFRTNGLTGVNGGVIVAAPFLCTKFQITATTDAVVECELTFEQADLYTVAAAA